MGAGIRKGARRLAIVIGAADVQFAHLGLQSRALQSQPLGGAAVARYTSGCFFQSRDDGVGFCLMKARRGGG